MTTRNYLYLDVCTLCRPFDDQSAMRIQLETNAYYLILQAVQDMIWKMVVSSVHFQEVNAIEDLQERHEILGILNRFGKSRDHEVDSVRTRAEALHTIGFGIADAAHLAVAEATADYFISCDDKLLKKCRREQMQIETFNPVEFTIRENLR